MQGLVINQSVGPMFESTHGMLYLFGVAPAATAGQVLAVQLFWASFLAPRVFFYGRPAVPLGTQPAMNQTIWG